MLPLHKTGTLHLLQGGRDFFPALVKALDAAQTWVQLETYIFDFHGAGAEVAEALVRAAGRGVTVQVLVDGIGTSPLPAQWREKFARPKSTGLCTRPRQRA
jgi:cardiolipin synthase